MTSVQRMEWAKALLPLLEQAGREILQHFEKVGTLEVQTKADHTPLTAADLASHDILLAGLQKLTPEIPVLSEEADIPPLSERGGWPLVWLVDPLDGTREFIDASDQFCINIALSEKGIATLGLIYYPVKNCAYVGVRDEGAWLILGTEQKREQWQAIRGRSVDPKNMVMISSRRRFTPRMSAFEDHLRAVFGSVSHVSMGSAMKYCEVAVGQADIYPCFGPTGEWDTAAGQVIVEASGGEMLSLDFKPFRYNQRTTMLNEGFYLLADKTFNWRKLIEGK